MYMDTPCTRHRRTMDIRCTHHGCTMDTTQAHHGHTDPGRLLCTFTALFMQKNGLPLITVVFITFLVIFESSLQSARDGLNVWLNTVFPSLLPFMVASEMLRNSGLMNRLESSLSLSCGPCSTCRAAVLLSFSVWQADTRQGRKSCQACIKTSF